MQALTNQLRFALHRKARQAQFYKTAYYPAIPYYVKPNFIDIHDTYQKRSIEEVKAQFADKEFQIFYERFLPAPSDFHKEQKTRKAVAIIDIEQFNFSEYQLDRFKILVGPRYKKGQTEVKFSCGIYPTFEANFEKVNEQIYQVLYEAKRAP